MATLWSQAPRSGGVQNDCYGDMRLLVMLSVPCGTLNGMIQQ